MLIRYFAGAAHAAGAPSENLSLDPAAADALTVGGLRTTLGAERPALAKVLAVSTLLIDGRPAHDPGAPVPTAASVVDVLPPFAGG